MGDHPVRRDAGMVDVFSMLSMVYCFHKNISLIKVCYKPYGYRVFIKHFRYKKRETELSTRVNFCMYNISAFTPKGNSKKKANTLLILLTCLLKNTTRVPPTAAD